MSRYDKRPENHGIHTSPHAIVHHGPKVAPSTFAAPAIVVTWRMRALISGVVFTLISLIFFAVPLGAQHIFRAYLLGWWMAFTFAGGGLVLLMLQYVSGGKWGLLLRRPLEAMSRTLPLVLLLLVPIWLLAKNMYLWAAFPTRSATAQGLASKLLDTEQAHALNFKRPMLNPGSIAVQCLVVFGILLTFMYFLNKWSLQRDADPQAGTEPSFERWRTRFENLSGIGILIYVFCLTVLAIDWLMALDPTWYSSIWGLKFLVGQGYGVLALSVLTVILLSRVEPMKTMLRTTEQHDLGKFMFAFVMLNIYLTFAEFLIIWSGNLPDEISWYLNRIRGGWWFFCTADFVCHWVIPFTLLLSRELKRSKTRMIYLCCFMIFARMLDFFWIIEPAFPDAASNLHFSVSILAYLTVPSAVISFWAAFYLHQLQLRPLINVNDSHFEEMLEAEHAH